MTSSTGKIIIIIHISLNISRSKDNQTMKFSLLIEYSMRNIFLEISYTKLGGETSLKPFSKIPNVWYVKVEEYQNILKLRR